MEDYIIGIKECCANCGNCTLLEIAQGGICRFNGTHVHDLTQKNCEPADGWCDRNSKWYDPY